MSLLAQIVKISTTLIPAFMVTITMVLMIIPVSTGILKPDLKSPLQPCTQGADASDSDDLPDSDDEEDLRKCLAMRGLRV